jgi:hypothetical protein
VARRAAPPAAAATAAPPKPAPAKRKRPPAPQGDEVALLTAQWSKIVAHAGRIAVAVQGALKDAWPAAVEGDTVHIDFDPEFASELSVFESPRNRKAVERSLTNVLKRPVTATFQEGKERPAQVQESPAPEETYRAATPAEPVPRPARKGNAQAWKQRDEVKQVLDMFNGTIVDVRE